MNEQLQEKIRAIILKYFAEDSLKPQYDGMSAYEIAGFIVKEIDKAEFDDEEDNIEEPDIDDHDEAIAEFASDYFKEESNNNEEYD